MRERLVRTRNGQSEGHAGARVTFVELFFDLVFVFAVTQLSHSLLHQLTLGGAAETALLLLRVWWVWIFTAWVTNWLDPEATPVRVLLLAMMLAGLVLSMSIPEAFGDRGLAFAAAYAALQVGRPAFTIWALGDHSPANARNFRRILSWAVLSGVFWIAGGLAHDEVRLALWVTALAIDYAAPWAGFRVPGLGHSTSRDWDVDGSHIAERCALFVIIALGESILVTGVTFGGAETWTAPTAAAFVAAFVGTVAMWWIYFDVAAERGSRSIAASVDPGRMARAVYTYIHLPIGAGIIVAAVADELVLAHPAGHADPAAIAAVLGGPALYLLGNLAFKWALAGRPPLSHMVGLGLLAALLPFAGHWPLLLTGSATSGALVVVAAWESLSLRRGPSPARAAR